MVAALHSSFQIYPEEFHTGFNETLVQETDAFNARSNGAIVLGGRRHEGYYLEEAFFKAVSGLVARRDLTSDPATGLGDLPLTEDENIGVKLFRRIGPVAVTRGAFRSIQRDPGEFSVLMGQQAAKGTAIDMLNGGLRAGVAAISVTAGLIHNVTASSPVDTISTDHLIQTLAKAGDSAGDIVMWVMHSTAYYKLVRDQVASHSFDAVAGVNIATGMAVTLGRPVLITDSPVLHGNTSPTDPVRILGLRRGGINIEQSEEPDMVIDDVTGGGQLAVRVQGEMAYTVNVMGYKYAISGSPTPGGVNPTDAVVAAAANWDQVATSDKSCAGVLMIADPS